MHTGNSILLARSQIVGEKRQQEDSIRSFKDECVVVADGVGSLRHGEVASSFVSETAIWTYTHVRQRPFYWEDKHLFLKRIFRTSNLALWNKQREPEYTDGLASTLCVAIIGEKKIWVGSVGDSRVFFIRDELIDELVAPEIQKNIVTPMALGFQRSGISPRFASEDFLTGDMLVIATDGVADFITEEDLRNATVLASDTKESLMKSIQYLFAVSTERKSKENMSLCIIKKI